MPDAKEGGAARAAEKAGAAKSGAEAIGDFRLLNRPGTNGSGCSRCWS